MINGRPQIGAWLACFYSIGAKDNCISLKYDKNVSGWCFQLSEYDENFELKGKGKRLLGRGRIFIGDFKKDYMKSGKLYELQHD
jgi:hypothetical protein